MSVERNSGRWRDGWPKSFRYDFSVIAPWSDNMLSTVAFLPWFVEELSVGNQLAWQWAI